LVLNVNSEFYFEGQKWKFNMDKRKMKEEGKKSITTNQLPVIVVEDLIILRENLSSHPP
jgi:hypothetical protein